MRSTLWALAPLLGLFAFVCLMHLLAPSDPDGWKPSNDVLMIGAIKGLTLSLLAVGIALVYRTNRIINFAQADLGSVPGALAVSLMVGKNWGYWFAFPLGLVAAIVLGVIVEFTFVRRFFKSPRLILTVATIGIAQILVGFSVFIPGWLDFGNRGSTGLDEPFGLSFSIDITTFDGHEVMALITVPVVLTLLGLFLRFTTIGVALRGAAESSDRAALLGIPVRLLQTLVWSIAASLAYIAFFLNTGIKGFQRGQPAIDLLLVALGAVVIGRFDRIPTIVATAIGFGLVDQAIFFDWGVDAYRSGAVAALIIAGVFFVREQRGSRVSAGAISTWQTVQEVRGIPRELSGERPIRIARMAFTVVLGIIVVALPLVYDGQSEIRLMGVIGIFAIIGVSMVMLSGWAGHVSLGQMAIVALGGVAGTSMTTLNDQDLVVGILVGGIVGAVALVAIGIPALRAKGISLGITTLALSFATSDYLLNSQYSPPFLKDRLPSFTGYYFDHRPDLLWSINVDSERAYYYLIAACLVLAILGARGIRRSRTGRAIVAIRENERAGQAFGVPARTTFVTALATSGFVAGAAGALFVHQQLALDTSNFEPFDGLTLFAIVVVGGLGSINGAIAGSIYVWGAEYFMPDEMWFLSQGFGLLLVLMFFPGGLGAMFAQVRDNGLRWYAKRHGIRVPSLVADTLVTDEFVATDTMIEAVADATELTEEQVNVQRLVGQKLAAEEGGPSRS